MYAIHNLLVFPVAVTMIIVGRVAMPKKWELNKIIVVTSVLYRYMGKIIASYVKKYCSRDICDSCDVKE